MKKILIILLMFSALLPSIFAKSMEGTGTGEDERTARVNAQLNLMTKLRSNITSANSDLSMANSYGVAYEQFSSQIIQQTSFDLISPYWDVKKKNGQYSATCTIDESQLNIYLDAYNTEVETINRLYENLGKTADKNKQSIYEGLIDSLNRFEGYRIIIRALSPNESLTRPAVTSAAAIQSEYLTYLETQINDARVTIGAYSNTNQDFLSESDRMQYSSALASFNELVEAGNELRKEMGNKFLESNLSTIESLKDTLSSDPYDIDKEDFAVVDENSISYYVNQIEANKLMAGRYKENLDSALGELETSYEEEVEEVRALGMSNISESEMNEYGEMTYDALSRREELISNEVERLYKDYTEMGTKTYLEGIKRLEELTKENEKLIKAMNKKRFTLDSNTSEIMLSIDHFDFDKKEFIGEASVVVGSAYWSFNINIPYKAVAEEDYKEADDIYTYTAQIAAIDEYIALINSSVGLFNIESEFSVEGDVNAYEYSVNIDGYEIINNITGKTIVRNRNPQGTYITISRYNINDYSVENNHLIDEKKYKDYVDDYYVTVIDEVTGGTKASLQKNRDNSFEKQLENSVVILGYFGGSAGIEKYGADLGTKIILPLNIGKMHIYPSLYAGFDLNLPWNNPTGRKNAYTFLEAGIMFDKTFRKGFITLISFGPTISWGGDDLNTFYAGLRLEFLFKKFIRLGVNWSTKPFDTPDFWASKDFGVDLALSVKFY